LTNSTFIHIAEIEEVRDTFDYLYELSQILDTSRLDRFENEILRFEGIDSVIPVKQNQILFIGSSSIRKWKTLHDDMEPLYVIQRGFGGSTIPEVIFYARRIIFPYAPKTIVIYAGENDLVSSKVQAEDVLKTCKLFVKTIKYYLPETHIYFVSIKPSIARLKYLDKMLKANVLIKKYTQEEKIVDFIDVSSSMLDRKGNVKENIFIHDNLHLNEKGYKIWTKKIKKHLLN
jgi:lysophospholipase L1-like esterase